MAESRCFVALVDLAPLVPGHLLAVPRTNLPSFAVLPEDAWQDWRTLRERLSGALAARWSKPAILEHGSTYAMGGGACITHAHLHLLPLAIDFLAETRRDGMDMIEVADQRDILATGESERPYLYYESAADGAWFSWADEPVIPRQYIRRVVARVLGMPEQAWDWGVAVNRSLLRQTVAELREPGENRD